MEALISLALLMLGILAAADAFSSSKDAMQRAERSRRIAAAADAHLVDTLDGATVPCSLSTTVTWRHENHPYSNHFDLAQWRARDTENLPSYEETFETLAPRK
jgi:hypothetical protein